MRDKKLKAPKKIDYQSKLKRFESWATVLLVAPTEIFGRSKLRYAGSKD